MVKLLQKDCNSHSFNPVMSLILNQTDWKELCQQSSQQLRGFMLEDFEELWEVPKDLGQGFSREIKLAPGIRLNLSDCKYDRDFKLQTPVHDHPVQFMIVLAGAYHNDIYPTFNRRCSYFSGSGVSPAYVESSQVGQHIVSVSVEIEPKVLDSYLFAGEQSRSTFKKLCQENDWKVSFYPKVSFQMRSLAYQILKAPYRGAAKQIYLQGKVFELLALYLNLISTDLSPIKSSPNLKPKTIASLHHAREVLNEQFEHPPSLTQLAHQVGVSQRTLQRGFPILFETTVMGYLKQQRLDRAEILLRENQHSVAEVAIQVGYGNIGHFSVAFKSRFGITPSQCLAGNKADFEQANGGF